MVEFTGLCETADKEGFLVVFPNGSGRDAASRSWNARNIKVYAARHNIDDVKFVNCLLDDLLPSAQVDAQRVYGAGMSNGGLFCYRLAEEVSHRIAAIGTVACAAVDFDGKPKLPMPVIHFHGTDDTFVPYFGGDGKQSLTGTTFKSVPETTAFWARHNGCEFPPAQDALPDAGDGTRILRHLFTDGDGGSEVQLYTIEGGGHTWPGQRSKYDILGRTTMQIDANELMWQFFQRFQRTS